MNLCKYGADICSFKGYNLKILFENIILDTPILLSTFLFFLRGWNKGVIKPVMNFLSFFLAGIFSTFVSFFISSYIQDNFLKNIIIERFFNVCSKSDVHHFPKHLLVFFNFCGVSDSILEKTIHKPNSGEILFSLASPFIINAVRIVIGSIIFAIIISVFKKISKISCKIFSAPVLSQFNSLVGALLGVLKGIFIVWGCILFLKVALIYWSDPPEIFSGDSIRCSFIFSKFYYFNPMAMDILKKIPFINDLDVSQCSIFLK